MTDPNGIKKISLYHIFDAGSDIITEVPLDLGDNEQTTETLDVAAQWKYRNLAFIIDHNNILWCFAWFMTSDPSIPVPDDPLMGEIRYRISQDMGVNWSDWVTLTKMGEANADTMPQVILFPVLTIDNKIMLFIQNDYGGSGSGEYSYWLPDP